MQQSLSKEVRRSRVRPLRYFLRRCFKPKTVNIDGIRMIVDPSRVGFRTVKALYHGDYEAPERLILQKIIKPGDKILEAGAGMGLISLTMARIVGAKNVVSYEPMPVAYALLVDNASLNNLEIGHRPRALAARSGKISFYVDTNIVASSLFSRAASTHIEVNADGIEEELQATRPNTLVLDIEGAEVELIKSCSFGGIEKIIMEVHPHIVGEQAIGSMVESLYATGFRENAALSFGRVMTFLR